MTMPSFRDRTFVRSVVLGTALVMSSIGGLAGIDHATADTLVPRADAGGPGGGGGGAVMIDETARAASLIALTTDSDATVARHPTANERSIALIESTLAPGGVLAGGTAPPARVPYEESEHAVAQNRGVASQLPPQAAVPGQPF